MAMGRAMTMAIIGSRRMASMVKSIGSSTQKRYVHDFSSFEIDGRTYTREELFGCFMDNEEYVAVRRWSCGPRTYDWVDSGNQDEILLPEEGCDYEHWQVWAKALKGYPTKDTIIQYYITILSQLLGSEEYSVATKHYYAFGANIPLELATKLEDLPMVSCIVPDVYADPIEKTYPWDPFINGKALPYNYKYYANTSPVGVSVSDEEKDLSKRTMA